MNKKIISAVMAAATALSLSVSAFAASASHQDVAVNSLVQIPVISLTWPTTAGVVFNPYKMALTMDQTKGTVTVDKTGKTGEQSTIVSNVLKFKNGGESEVAITVTASVKATTTVDSKGNPLTDNDGNPTTAKSTKISIATAPIKQPTWDAKGEKIVAGDTKNSVFLYIAPGTTTDGAKTWTFPEAYDSKDTKHVILKEAETVTKNYIQISNVATPTGNNEAAIKVCGDIATAPTIGWDEVNKTDSISVKLVFDASPVAPLPEKPVTP